VALLIPPVNISAINHYLQALILLDTLRTTQANKVGTMQLEQNDFWQTTSRGTHNSEYQLYLDHSGDSKGNDITTGKPLKTFDEWMNS
jgi:hypothetical protein